MDSELSMIYLLRRICRREEAEDTKFLELGLVKKSQRYPSPMQVPQVKAMSRFSLAYRGRCVAAIYDFVVRGGSRKELCQGLANRRVDGDQGAGICGPLEITSGAIDTPRNSILISHPAAARHLRSENQNEDPHCREGTDNLPFVHLEYLDSFRTEASYQASHLPPLLSLRLAPGIENPK